MANCNRQAINRKLRLKRRRREVQRLLERCASANAAAAARGEQPTDFTRRIKAFKGTRT
jgi:hypothetical protein